MDLKRLSLIKAVLGSSSLSREGENYPKDEICLSREHEALNKGDISSLVPARAYTDRRRH